MDSKLEKYLQQALKDAETISLLEKRLSELERKSNSQQTLNNTSQDKSSSLYTLKSSKDMKFVESSGEILPIENGRNILITSALPYVNNIPHLGNIVGSVLSADVFSRYCKARGYNTLFICGTDEYGTATETKALQEGLTPKQICDKYNKIHESVYKWFDIKFDKFGRTSTAEQTAITQDIFFKLYNKGFISEDTLDQLYCEKCSRFLADRYVEGTCYYCKYEDARGDQCDKCGKLLNPIELIKPRCQVCRSPPVIKNSKHLFLNLTKLTEKLEAWIDQASTKGEWDSNAIQITRAWIKEGLRPRCITRDLKWGTPVPLKGYENKVFYVWFDAPIGYISITANYTKSWEKWWKNPKNIDLYQFMGKDNIPFHTVMFPSSLLGTDDPYTLLHHISTTEYLNYEDTKFSKSRGIGVFGTDAENTGIPSEVWRYYLLINRPETSDSSFLWDDLLAKVNGELISNLGNLVNRSLSFTKKEFKGIVPPLSELSDLDIDFIHQVNGELAKYIHALEHVQIKDGLKIAMHISALGNLYLQSNNLSQKLLASQPKRCETVINISLNLSRLLGTLLEPYIPGFHDKLFSQLNWQKQKIPETFTLDIPAGHQIGEPQIIFKKLSKEQIETWKSKFGGRVDPNKN